MARFRILGSEVLPGIQDEGWLMAQPGRPNRLVLVPSVYKEFYTLSTTQNPHDSEAIPWDALGYRLREDLNQRYPTDKTTILTYF